MEYHYLPNATGQFYLSQIVYTGHVDFGYPLDHSVWFYYEDRPDVSTAYTTLAGETISERLQTIIVSANGKRVRTYALKYTISPSTGRSLLASVQQFGDDAEFIYIQDDLFRLRAEITNEDTATKLPAQTFEWSAPPSSIQVDKYMGTSFGSSLAQTWVNDVTGDARADYVYRRNNTRDLYVLSSIGSQFCCQLDPSWGSMTYEHHTAEWSGMTMADVNGDGSIDSLDVTLMLQRLMGEIPKFPVEP